MKPEPAPRTGGWLPRGPCCPGPECRSGGRNRRTDHWATGPARRHWTAAASPQPPRSPPPARTSPRAARNPAARATRLPHSGSLLASPRPLAAGPARSAAARETGHSARRSTPPIRWKRTTPRPHDGRGAKLSCSTPGWGAAGPRDEGLGFITGSSQAPALGVPTGGRRPYDLRIHSPYASASRGQAVQSANFQHGRRE